MSQLRTPENERAIVYIDGFNLYFGLRQSCHGNGKGSGKSKMTKRCYWLDVQKLAENLVQQRELVSVKYFTARIKGNVAKQERQNAFLSAIQSHCNKLRIFEGRYILRQMMCVSCHEVTCDIVCPKCQYSNNLPEEKKSDVNIASQMLQDAYTNKFDVAYLLSGDSDLVPPIEIIRAMIPPKRVFVVFPPSRFSQELKDKADCSLFLYPNMIKKSVLPDEIIKPNGEKLVIPERWK